jgi:hypothetical protein
MSDARKPKISAALLVAICALGVVLLVRPKHNPAPLTPARSTPSPIAAAAPAEAPATAQASVVLPIGQLSDRHDPSLPATIELETGTLPWEAAIDAVLAGEGSKTDKVEKLFGLLATQPVESWPRITEEIIKLTPNRSYNAEVFPRLVNPQTSGQVEGLLFADLMERPESIQLPALLAISRMPAHPFAAPARDNLVHALGKDYESDWAAWQEAIRRKGAK